MNVADSLRVASSLEQLGYRNASKPEEADIIVLNTCVVRQSAEDKAIGRLMSLTPLKKNNPDLVINLMGCLVGVKGFDKLKKRFPQVDVFSSPSDIQPLINYLRENEHQKMEMDSLTERNLLLDGDIVLPEEKRGSLVSSFISIVLGCSHACSYCIIPSRRGVEVSRDPETILQEAHSMAAQGVKEITLLGQIVDRYGKDNPAYPKLHELLYRMQEVEGLERIRFLTSHPNWMTDELLQAVADLPKVMPHIEVPAQAGDDEVLKNMRRGYTGGEYRDLIAHIREIIPGVSIGTDIIVGFPGESEEQFMNTYRLLEDLKMDVAHLARYSPRPGTISATRMEDDVPDEEKWRRFRMLEDLQKGISTGIISKYMGQKVPVLFENQKKGRWYGRTPTNKLAFVETEADLRGRVRELEITWTGPWSMRGELLEE